MSDLMAASRVNYQQIKSKTARRVMGTLVLPVFLSACLGANVDQIVQRQCPSVAILNTADKLPLDGQTVELNAASLTCSIDRNQDNALLADVTLTGRVSEKVKMPIFVAALDIENRQLSRTQFAVTGQGGVFNLTLPPVIYGKKGDGSKARLVAGFVLTPAQLAANRADYRQKLGLGE
jgi:hypothetical protein